jgi:hypothetical protein
VGELGDFSFCTELTRANCIDNRRHCQVEPAYPCCEFSELGECAAVCRPELAAGSIC